MRVRLPGSQSRSYFLNSLKPLAALVIALCALGLGVWTAMEWRATAAPPTLESGLLLPSPRPLAAFRLTDQDGKVFSNEQLTKRWSLLFVGFTHCPDVCPTTLSLMKLLEQRLNAERRDLQLVFISVDPERDTPQQMQKYVRYFSPTLAGVSGPHPELERLCANLGIAYVKVPGANAYDYTMDHSAALVLINPEGRVAGYFQAPHKLEALAADLARVIPQQS